MGQYTAARFQSQNMLLPNGLDYGFADNVICIKERAPAAPKK
jgi:hypothetical protein